MKCHSTLVRKSHPTVRRTALAILTASVAGSRPQQSPAGSVTWDGEGANANWSNPVNWATNVAPQSGDSLFFAGIGNLSASNDYVAGTSFAGITFNAGAGSFSLSGNSLTLGGNIDNNSGSLQTISNDLVLSANRTIYAGGIAASGLTLQGNITGGFKLTKDDAASTLTLAGASSSYGSLDVARGRVVFADGSTTALSGQSLWGSADNETTTVDLVSGATLTSSYQILGGQRATATFNWNITGGSASVSVLRWGNNGISNLTLSSGSLVITNSASSKLTENGTGRMTVSGTGLLQIGSTGTSTFNLATGTGTGELNLDGGTLRLGGFYKTNTTGSTTVRLNGGTIQARASSTTFLNALANVNAYVMSGGAAVDTNGFNVTIAQPLIHGSGYTGNDGGLRKTGSGALTLAGANDYSGSTIVSAGTLVLANASALGGRGGNLTVDGTLDSSGYSITCGTLSGSGTITSAATGARTLTINDTDSATFSGALQDGSGTLSIVKQGDGSLTLSGANAFTGSTTINGGTLTLAYTSSNTAKLGGGRLTLADGSIRVVGGATALTESLGGLTLNQGLNQITNESGNATVALGAITRSLGGIARFTDTAAGSITTTTGTAGAVLGGWATFGNSDFASRTGSNDVVAFSAYTTQNTVASWSGGQNLTDSGSGFTGTLVNDLSINSLRFNAPASSAVNIATTTDGSGNPSGKTLTVSSTGILVTPAVGANNVSISGGRVNGGGGELTIHQNNPLGTLTISSQIMAGNLSKTGAGKLILNGDETNNGSTWIHEGTLAFGPSYPMGSGTERRKTYVVDAGATLDISAAAIGAYGYQTYNQNVYGNGTIVGDLDWYHNSYISPGTDTTTGSLTLDGTLHWSLAIALPTLRWQINDAEGTAGGARGWDVLRTKAFDTGTVTTSTRFANVSVSGSMANFDAGKAYAWPVLQVTGGTGATGLRTGFGTWQFSDVNLDNPTHGRFSLEFTADKKAVNLTYTPLTASGVQAGNDVFQYVDLTQPSLAGVKQALAAGGYQQALSLYRDIVLDRIATTSLAEGGTITDIGSPIAITNARFDGDVNQSLTTGGRIDALLKGLAQACNYDLAKARYDADPLELGYALWHQGAYNGPQLVGVLPPNGYSAVANQTEAAALSLLRLDIALSDFKSATDNFKDGLSTWEYAGSYTFRNASGKLGQGGNAHPDGSGTEPSFNYNGGMIGTYGSLVDLYGGSVPAWVGAFRDESVVPRLRFETALLLPDGSLPALAQQANSKIETTKFDDFASIAQDPVSTSLVNLMLHRGVAGYPQTNPAFTSIAFPYGGHYVMRSGWDTRAQYLYMHARNDSTVGGHADGAMNHVSITAYGKPLLISSGSAYTVSNPTFQNSMMASINHNTVTVDGRSQLLGDRGVDTNRSPLTNRWHSSTAFDLAEGTYGNGYEYYGTTGSTIRGIDHNRQTTYIKELGVYVLLDRMMSAEDHQYTQNWTFAPTWLPSGASTRVTSFTPSNVLIDSAGQRVHTTDTSGANISIYNFGPTLSYASFYGTTNAATYPAYRGWVSGGPEGDAAAVHVESTWSGTGDSNLITLVAPSPNTTDVITVTPTRISSSTASGFEAVLGSSRSLTYLASNHARTSLSQWNVTSNAESMLLSTIDNKATISGVILGGTSLTLNGTDIMPPVSEFEFRANGSGLISWSEVSYPLTFAWNGTSAADTTPYYGNYGTPWNSSTGGTFNTAGDWYGGTAPTSAGQSANLNVRLAADATLPLSTATTLGGIHFQNPLASYTVGTAAGPAITLNNTPNAGDAVISNRAGTHSIAANISLASPLTLFAVHPLDTINLSGAISGTGAVTVGGEGVSSLSGANTFTGDITLCAGRLRVASDASLGNSANRVIFSQTGNLQLSGSLTSARTFETRGYMNVIDTNGYDATISGPIMGEGGFTKSGAGTLTISGANTFESAVTVNAGTLALDYRANNNNKLSSTAGLTMAGGTLSIIGNSTAFTQAIQGLNLNAGASQISNATGNTTLDFGATLVRQTGAVLNITLGSTGQTKMHTTPIGWCTVGDDWATTGSDIVSKLSSYGTTWSSGTNTNLSTNLTASGTTNSLRFASPVTLTLSATSTISTGGILVPSSVTGATRITGSTLNSGNSKDLIIHQKGSGTLAIESAITDNGSSVLALTKAGSGALTLSGTNTYTGPTYILGGTISVASMPNGGVAGPLGDSAATNANLIISGGALRYTGGAATSDRLFSFGTRGATLDASGTGALSLSNTRSLGFNGEKGARTLTLTGTSTAANTLSAAIHDADAPTSVTKSGTGSWSLTGANHYTGPTTITGGTLNFAGSYAPAISPETQLKVTAGSASIAAGAQASFYSVSSPSSDVTVNGTLRIAPSSAGSVSTSRRITGVGSVSLSRGRLDIAQGITANSLALTNGAQLRQLSEAGTSVTSTIRTSLCIDGNSTWDIADSSVILPATSEAAIRSLIARGYGSGNWLGTGITSSTAQSDLTGQTTIGYASAGELGLSSFGSVSGLTGTETLIRITAFGDADLNGVVNADDYTQFLVGFRTLTPAKWINGDFDYNGVVNADDYTLLLTSFAASGAAPTASMTDFAREQGVAIPSNAVPEPTGLALLIAPLTVLSARQRRHERR